jgi:hypothetical protein
MAVTTSRRGHLVAVVIPQKSTNNPRPAIAPQSAKRHTTANLPPTTIHPAVGQTVASASFDTSCSDSGPTDAESDTKSDSTEDDPETGWERNLSLVAESKSAAEQEEILKWAQRYKVEGHSKPNHSKQTTKLLNYELEKWIKYGRYHTPSLFLTMLTW